MKTLSPLILAMLCAAPILSAETTSPSLDITVKRQLLDSDHELVGLDASTSEKKVTLRVVLRNISGKPINGATLDGTALILREIGSREMVRNDALGSLEVPLLLPNETFTFDLGSITLRTFESNRRDFQETLEAWKVTCSLDGKSLSEATTGEFGELEAQLRDQKPLENAGPRAVPGR